MAKVVCPSCGQTLHLQGLAAICPHCDAVVFANRQPRGPEETENDSTLAPTREQYELYETPAVSPPWEDGQYVQPAVDPSAEERLLQAQLMLAERRRQRQNFWIIITLCATACVFLLVVGIFLAVASRKQTGVQTVVINAPPAPPPAAVAPRPPTRPAEPPAPRIAPPTSAPEPAIRPTTSAASASSNVAATQPAKPHANLLTAAIRQSSSRPKEINDEQIGKAIERGAAYLRSELSGSRLKNADRYDSAMFEGLNALVIYSLLHCGEALGDPQLQPQSPTMAALLDRLKEYEMNRNYSTYSRSLRISALVAANRPADRAAIEGDVQYLLKSSMRGAFTYYIPPAGMTREQNSWDNSNSQYGALGIWAAGDAGVRVPLTFWNDVEQHWVSTQTASGGWGYGAGDQGARLSMTAAGLNMLFVARDQKAESASPQPLSRPIERAMEWLDEADHAIKLPPAHRGYALYGLERAGLASGYKYFGAHDWYIELASTLLTDQRADGSWEGEPNAVSETALSLLFLSRGRHPVLMAKLKFDGAWNNRPRDLSVFTRFASYQLERPLNWEVADPQRQWFQWSDASVIYISSNRAPSLDDAQIEKLRRFAENGGLIFLNTESESAEFDQFVANLSTSLFPSYPLAPVPLNHPVYSTVFNMTEKPPLLAVSNGSRLMLIHSKADLAKNWQIRPVRAQRAGSELAMNIAIYANGRRDLRNRLVSNFVPLTSESPAALVPVARLEYSGNWNPEPAGWERTSRILQSQSGLSLDLSTTKISQLSYEKAFLAHLTGTNALECSELEVQALRRFVSEGGTLLIDACGGSKAFADSVESKLLPKLFPDSRPMALSPEQGILRSAGAIGMKDLAEPQLRPGEAVNQIRNPLQIVMAGKGRIVFSRLDISTGLSGASTADLAGFTPRYCQDLIQNLIVWSTRQLAAK